MAEDCLLCSGAEGERILGAARVWEDRHWRLVSSTRSQVPGFSMLFPRRHIPFVTDLDGAEARTFGGVLARCATVLREETDTERVWVHVYGHVPHLHVHLAPHREGDALNDQLLRGEVEVEELPGGAKRVRSLDYPEADPDELAALIERVRERLADEPPPPDEPPPSPPYIPWPATPRRPGPPRPPWPPDWPGPEPDPDDPRRPRPYDPWFGAEEDA